MSAPYAEVIGECRAYALQELETAEHSELYPCGMQHLKQIILFFLVSASLSRRVVVLRPNNGC